MSTLETDSDKKIAGSDECSTNKVKCKVRYVFCLLHFLSLTCMYQVKFQSLLYFPRYGPDRHQLWKNKWLWGDNSVNIHGRSMVLVYFPSSPCHQSINQISFHSHLYFQRYGLERHLLWKTKWLKRDHYKYTG